MLLQYCSDLHLEFPKNRSWLGDNPIPAKGEILIVAGDTYHLGEGFKRLPIWDELGKHFGQVFVLPGNHEYYKGYDVRRSMEMTNIALRPNVRLVNNVTVEYSGVEFIFSILCRLLTNQLGYIHMREHKGFEAGKVIEVVA